MNFLTRLSEVTEEVPRIAVVGVVVDNKVLTGRRRDNGLWTFPGGHVDEGERIQDGAIREVLEESGITIDEGQLQWLASEMVVSHRAVGKRFLVFPFIATINDKERASNKNDPDDEISEWKWVDIHPDTPELQPKSRHAKNDLIVSYLLNGVA